MSVHYQEYLQLDSILQSQKLLTKSHDEMLFVIVHQCYELWFKQIHHDIDSICSIFQQNSIPENQLSICLTRIQRINKILELFVQQLSILETMDPINFLEFRGALEGASGFQSFQFRQLEVKLGIDLKNNPFSDAEFYFKALRDEERQRLSQLYSNNQANSLFLSLEKWLERTPFLQIEEYSFWNEYKKSLEKYYQEGVGASENTKKNLEVFNCLFDDELYSQLKEKQNRRLSRKATLAGLFIILYKDHPLLAHPYRLLISLVDMDELLSTWRFRHSIMAHRMIGSKIGTGGSSGHEYLMKATMTRRPFLDFFELTTFLIPKENLPELPRKLSDKLNFNY